MENLIEMKITKMAADPLLNTPVLLLEGKGPNSHLSLPIWIGTFEAHSIAVALHPPQGISRPLPYDIIKEILDMVPNMRLEKVVITDLRDNIFFAKMIFGVGLNANFMEQDARPSDAIATAVRTGSPIFVAESVFRKADRPGARPEKRAESRPDSQPESDAQKVAEDPDVQNWLEGLKPEDFESET